MYLTLDLSEGRLVATTEGSFQVEGQDGELAGVVEVWSYTSDRYLGWYTFDLDVLSYKMSIHY